MGEARARPDGEFESWLKIEEGDGAMLEFPADNTFSLQAEAVAMSGQGSMSTPQTWQEPTTGMRFVRIPGGCYETLQGAAVEPPVCLQPFDLGVYEVSFADYDRFARETARELPDDMGWGRGQRVSWKAKGSLPAKVLEHVQDQGVLPAYE